MLQNKSQKHREHPIRIMDVICLMVLFLIISVILAFAVISPTLAAKVTMEVYQQSDHKAFGNKTSLDIFNDPKYNGQKITAPFSVGNYSFGVYNNSNSDPLPYTLELEATNPENIPLVYSLQKNGEYILGGSNDEDMVFITEYDFSEVLLDGQKTDLYTLNWRWATKSDAEDTKLGEDAAAGKTLEYTLNITAIGSLPYADVKDPGTSNGSNIGKTIVDKFKAVVIPKTGDSANVIMWGIILILCLGLLLVMLFSKKRRKDKDENN